MGIRLHVAAALLMTSSWACKQTSPSPAEMKQLSSVERACKTWNTERIQEVEKSLPSGFLVGWDTTGKKAKVIQAFAGLPNKYLNALYKQRSDPGGKPFRVVTLAASGESFPSGMVGGTPISVISGGDLWTEGDAEESIIDPNSRLLIDTVLHELGHALTPMIARWSGKPRVFGTELQKIAVKDRTNPMLNWYPKAYPTSGWQYRGEFFAEAFVSYYCSEAVHQDLAERFPTTYDFLKQYLEPPVWKTASTDVASTDGAKPVDSGTPDKGGSDKDKPKETAIKVALGSKPASDGSHHFYFSVNREVSEVVYCLGDDVVCDQEDATWFATKAAKGRGGAKLYAASGTNKLQDRTCMMVGSELKDTGRWSFRQVMVRKSKLTTAEEKKKDCVNGREI